MSNQIPLPWGAAAMRRGPKARPSRASKRERKKCLADCGKDVGWMNRRGYCHKCYPGSPARRAHYAAQRTLRPKPPPPRKCVTGCGSDIGVRNTRGYCHSCRHLDQVRREQQYARADKRRSTAAWVTYRLIPCRKAKAKRSGLPFAITLADLEPLPTHCPVVGIELCYGNKKRLADNSASIDRINPKLGYVPGNVRIVSHRANRLKSDATAEELAALAADAAVIANRPRLRSV